MHKVLVEELRWISDARFLHALNYCMLLPGPEAQQLATYIGWLLHRTAGGLIAGLLFILPGMFALLALSVLYVLFQGVTVVDGLFFGLKPAVVAVVVEALLRIGKRALRTRLHLTFAIAAFVAICFLEVPFPAIVLGAGVAGFLADRAWPGVLHAPAKSTAGGDDSLVDRLLASGALSHTRPDRRRALRIALVCAALWFAPIAVFAAVLGPSSVFVQSGLFFGQAAVVTFGGAYAVLAFVAQRAVDTYGWLAPGEALDGLGLAETTPGPLIMVVQFVGFLAAYRDPGPFSPMAGAVVGALLTTWVTFVPCFLWIFVGAPYIESLRGRRGLDAALSAITAAVVGVILNLSVWFSLHTVFGRVDDVRGYGLRLLVPDVSTLAVPAAVICAGALVAMLRFKVGMGRTLLASALAGLVWRLAT